jgi:hypothetical protein
MDADVFCIRVCSEFCVGCHLTAALIFWGLWNISENILFLNPLWWKHKNEYTRGTDFQMELK